MTSFASISALHCSKRRQTSSWPLKADKCSGVYRLEKSKKMNLPHENDENKRGAEGGVGQLQSVSLVDGISISNHMAKHRNAVSVFCRIQNIAVVCNAGSSSSLHTRMNAAARLMQPLRCAATLRTSKPATVSCSTRQTHSTRKHWHDKRSAHHSTRAAAAAPALSSRDPASHAPSPTQPSAKYCSTCAYQQAHWPVAGTRTPHRGA